MEEKLGKKLPAVSTYPDDMEEAAFTNCENMIGSISVPLGIAGPLIISNAQFPMPNKKGTYIPLATTEGALVASVNRGCKSIAESGGAHVWVENSGMSRGASFKTASLDKSMALRQFVNSHKEDIGKVAQGTSSHITLLSVFIKIVGRSVFIRFSFDCSEAMGMNMVTIAVGEICSYIEKETGARIISVASNFDVDKKPAWMNMVLGRGRQVWAEVEIPETTVSILLKTTSKKMHEVNIQKNLLGSAVAGSLGFNGHFANVVSAFYIATGQDPAHTVEGSLGVTTTDLTASGIAVSIYMPNVNVGTIGGGTKLPSQKEALEILGIERSKKGSADLLALYLGGAVLAGEISLLASLSEGSLGRAHNKLARGKI